MTINKFNLTGTSAQVSGSSHPIRGKATFEPPTAEKYNLWIPNKSTGMWGTFSNKKELFKDGKRLSCVYRDKNSSGSSQPGKKGMFASRLGKAHQSTEHTTTTILWPSNDISSLQQTACWHASCPVCDTRAARVAGRPHYYLHLLTPFKNSFSHQPVFGCFFCLFLSLWVWIQFSNF